MDKNLSQAEMIYSAYLGVINLEKRADNHGKKLEDIREDFIHKMDADKKDILSKIDRLSEKISIIDKDMAQKSGIISLIVAFFISLLSKMAFKE